MTPPAGDRRDRLAAMFAGELADRTRILEEGLLTLEQVADADRGPLLDELARAAHTLKGSSAMMGAPSVAARCHELEETLGKLRSRDRLDPTLLSRLLEEVDRIRQEGTELVPTGEEAGEDAAGGPGTSAPDAPTPPVPPSAEPRRVGSIRLTTDKLDVLVQRTAELRTATTALLAVGQRISGAERQLRVGRRGGTGGDAAAAWTTAATLVADVDRRVRPLLRGIERAATGVDAAVRDTVTVPVAEACDGLRRSVRDIARAQDKELRLRLAVDDAELDRRAVDVVRDALLHLVRNAADHGIEVPAVRQAAGKPAVGTIEVAAAVRGDRVVVTVADDGRGVDRTAVLAAARQAGVSTDGDAHELVFAAGLSTAAVTTDISGRGVGLDAVRERVESLRGTVTLTSRPGAGTEVTLTVPASLATARVLLVRAAGERLALPVEGVDRLIRVTREALVPADDRAWVAFGDRMLEVRSLASLAGLATEDPLWPTDRSSLPAVVVTGSAGTAAALVVDAVDGEQELLVQPVGPLLERLPGVVGAGVLTQGQVVLLFHPPALLRSGRQHPGTSLIDGATRPARRPRVLLAEDAPTTRALEQGLLEAAGFEVVAAVDGHDAWNRLRQESVDVVVSDIEMPGLGGIELCERIRSSPALRELPIVLVTSRGGEEDRRRGADAGADAYLVKSSFAQGELIATIARMLS
jgi:two-component system chemotaxis sensor kinase CheA